jgi:hypothetical protein
MSFGLCQIDDDGLLRRNDIDRKGAVLAKVLCARHPGG